MSASSKFCSDHLHVIDPSQEGLGWVSVDDQTCVTDDDDNGDGTVEIEDVLPHWEYFERGWHPMSADVSRLIEQGYAVGAKKVNTYWEHNGLRHRRKFCIQQRRQVRYVSRKSSWARRLGISLRDRPLCDGLHGSYYQCVRLVRR